MKSILIIFCIASLSGYSQNWTHKVDTIFHKNGELASVQNILVDSTGKSYRDGKFWNYNSKGTLIQEGEYAYRAFVQCVNCYEMIDNHAVKYDISKRAKKVTNVGCWKSYYQDGTLESEGCYSGKVHEREGANCVLEGDLEICDGWITLSHEKNKKWSYYDKKGQLKLEELYVDGTLVNERRY